MKRSFYDECLQKNYQVLLNSYTGNADDLRRYGIGSHKELEFKCSRCGKIFKRQLRLFLKSGIDRAYCESCGKYDLKSSNKAPVTLYDWLQGEGKRQFIELAIADDRERAKYLSVNSREEIEFKCNIHNRVYKKSIYSICKSKKCNLDCCKIVKFSFQDWFLLCYSVTFKVFIYNSGYEARMKKFAVEQVKQYYFNAESSNNEVAEGRTAQNIFEEEAFDSKLSVYLQCDKNAKYDYKPVPVELYRLTKGLNWCNSICHDCDSNDSNDIRKRKALSSLEDLLNYYGIGGERNADILRLKAEIESLEEEFSNGYLFSESSQKALRSKKEELAEKQADFLSASSKLLKEINNDRKRYTKKIIAVLERS